MWKGCYLFHSVVEPIIYNVDYSNPITLIIDLCPNDLHIFHFPLLDLRALAVVGSLLVNLSTPLWPKKQA